MNQCAQAAWARPSMSCSTRESHSRCAPISRLAAAAGFEGVMSMSSDFPGLAATELESRGAVWTTREIAQQPQMWLLVEKLIADQRARLDAFCGARLKIPAARIVLTGVGPSAHVGQCLAPTLSAHLHRRVDAIPTTDLVSAPRSYLQSEVPTLLVSFARSGNSPESVAAVDLAEREIENVRHLIITCNATGQ